MKSKFSFFVFITLLSLAVFAASSHAQLSNKIIKLKGGGDADILGLVANIPDDAQLLISVNWENLAKTDFLDTVGQAAGAGMGAFEAMGVDPKRDIKHLILGIAFKEEPDVYGVEAEEPGSSDYRFGKEGPDVYGVVAGDFDAEELMAKVKEEADNFEEMTWGSRKVYSVDDVYITFNESGLLFSGSDADAEGAMKRMLKAGEKNLANSKDMMRLVKDTDTSVTAWGAMIFPEELIKEFKSEAGDESPFDPESMKMANFSLNYAEKVTAKVALHFADADESSKLIDFLKDQIAAFSQTEAVPPPMKEILEALELKADGKAARASLSIEAEKLKESLGMLMMGGMVPGTDEEWEEDFEEEETEEAPDEEWGDETENGEEDLTVVEEKRESVEESAEDEWAKTKEEVENALEELKEIQSEEEWKKTKEEVDKALKELEKSRLEQEKMNKLKNIGK